MAKRRSRYFKRYNANPYGAQIPDCAIRAVSAGLNMPYQTVCRRLGLSWKGGHGLIRNCGVMLESIHDAFGEYFKFVQYVEGVKDFDSRNAMLKDLMKDPDFDASLMGLDNDFQDKESTLTLDRFMEEYDGQGDFLVGLYNETGEGHIVCAFCSKDPPFFVDTWDCGNLKVDCIMQIKKRFK